MRVRKSGRSFPLSFSIIMAMLCLHSVMGVTRIPLERFEQRTEGHFQSWIDRRDLLVMHHPWVPSTTGGYCEARATVSLPRDLHPPLRLSIYQTDDYFNDFWRAKNDIWLGGDGFYGHRFKQVRVNDRLVWESDVADANAPDTSSTLVLDLPDGTLLLSPTPTGRLSGAVWGSPPFGSRS